MVVSAPLHIAVSACLLGLRVRFDADHKRQDWFTDVPPGWLRVTSLCPEVEAGLGTPREPMSLVGNPNTPRLVGNTSGADHTTALEAAIDRRLAAFALDPPELFLLKAKSPSCGVGTTIRGALTGQDGLFAAAVARHFPQAPRIDEHTLSNFEDRSRIFAILRTGRRAVDLPGAPLDAFESWLAARFDP